MYVLVLVLVGTVLPGVARADVTGWKHERWITLKAYEQGSLSITYTSRVANASKCTVGGGKILYFGVGKAKVTTEGLKAMRAAIWESIPILLIRIL